MTIEDYVELWPPKKLFVCTTRPQSTDGEYLRICVADNVGLVEFAGRAFEVKRYDE